MLDKVIVLPQADEIIRRLTKVYDDDLAQNLYRNIAKNAGEERVAPGIVLMFASGIHRGYPPSKQSAMFQFIPKWIEALIDDKEVAREAVEFHEEELRAARK